jgi:predicted GIY-YIG superfamily endonuclease
MSYGGKYKVYFKPEKESNTNPEYSEPKTKKEYVPSKPRGGYVYLLRAENGMCKIGMTSQDIQSRVNQIERDVPLKMTVLHHFHSVHCRKAEMYLHDTYAEQRIRYEWFSLSQDQIEEIMKIKGEEIDSKLGLSTEMPPERL